MTDPARKPFRRRLVFGSAAAAILAAVVLLGLDIREPAEAQRGPQPPAAVPVQIATVGAADVPMLLDGLGTVQAYNTVTVRARVDGELQQVLFTEGQVVHAGDVLARIDPRPYQAALDQAVARKAQDEAQLANAQRDLQRYMQLASGDAVSRQQRDTQHSLVEQFQAAIAGDQAQIDNARTQLGYATITSPIDGVTGIRLLDQGNIVHATDTGGLVVITQVQPIAVIFSLPAARLPEIRRAMAAGSLAVTALDGQSGAVLAEGELALVDNRIDQATGSVRLKAVFPNADNALWPGQYVDARLQVRIEQGVRTVPSSAIQRGPDGSFVYVVRPDQTVAMQPVRVRRYANRMAVIDDGLELGAQVVAAGQYRLAPGARIEVQEPSVASAAPVAGQDQGR
ncbi:efflux RND transporter periplasmic adaptor subunit [Roseomonas hellenica]|uniref:Efflux RND transporter periplasmic adaptor subunit n=1 Tax=Plastoroseomonas hellenica TaxID=2687306 RepID=A0ABS5EYP6_9PROT|nr:efflux RND transporter periplasmic adaptor subunit [Plastoroseomonas hellenica]MBR0665413.1 efflux RND transporter periplasmic adaptor subunit [Plastoroseomonas hellenica]